jgi:hypothetical protein
MAGATQRNRKALGDILEAQSLEKRQLEGDPLTFR